MIKPAIFMATILWSSLGLVNIAFATDSPHLTITGEQLLMTESVNESSSPATIGEPTDSTDELPSYAPSETQPPVAEDSVEKSPSPATVEDAPLLSESIFAPFFKSHFGKNHSGVTVGYKAWINTWGLPLYPTTKGQDFIIEVHSETEISHIPVVSFRYENFLVSGSYFPKKDYSFNKITFIEETRISAERSEWDITAGYYLSQNLAITVGYKYISRDYLIKSPSKSESVSQSSDGFTLGLTSSVSLGRGFGLYGSFGYGRLYSSKLESSSDNDIYSNDIYSIPYYLGEMGLIYSLRFKNPSINAASFYGGYRFQHMDFDELIDNGQTARDSTDGFVLGVNLVF